MPYIELIQDKNTTNKLPSCFKGYAYMNPHLLSVYDHQIILDKIEAGETLIHDEYVEDKKITTIQILMIQMMITINYSYLIFNLL